MKTNPIIGLFANIDNEKTASVYGAYSRAIECAGGLPVLLPWVEDEKTIASFLSMCDGIFFTGGADLDPERYGEEKKELCGALSPYRDAVEFAAMPIALQLDKPILAVCRGAQLLNAVCGGTLYQDIPSELSETLLHRQTEDKFSPSHAVDILPETPLFALVGKSRMAANSFHHQAMKKIGEGLCVMARASDGIVEAMYMPKKRYVRAYQWHPERLCMTDADNRILFENFVLAAKGE